MIKSIISTLGSASLAAAVVVISDPNNPPHQVAKSQGQVGYNDCQNYKDSPTSMCQTVYFNDFDDFCVFAPPNPKSVIGDTEEEQVTWCSKAGHGARLIPSGTFTGLHWLQTAEYWQITAIGDFTKINVAPKDEGGELDPHGATGAGNPIGGLVLGINKGTYIQFQEWHEFIAYNELSLRACFHSTGKDTLYCPHIYDEMGSEFNDPGSYDKGFNHCQGQAASPAGIYTGDDGGVTTFSQGDSFTPDGPNPGKSSSCTTSASYKYATYSSSAKALEKTTTGKPHTTTTSTIPAKTGGRRHSLEKNRLPDHNVNPEL